MNVTTIGLIVFAIFSSLFASPAMAAPAAQAEGATQGYVCPPCPCGLDDTVHKQPGTCPACGMELIACGAAPAAQSAPPQPSDRRRAAILIFDGVQIIDYTGPYEVFGQAGMNVYTVAVSADPVTTAMGMRVVPAYTLADAPKPDVVVIPGGDVTRAQQDARILAWIQETSKGASHVLSVCNGAYILARTGLLDGLTATTFYDLIDGLAAIAPKTRVVRDRRFVDNGKFITTAGISSGIDGSLHVVSKLFGKSAAQMAALNMEYNWQPDSTYARGDFADRPLRRIFGRRFRLNPPGGASAEVLNTAGDATQWEVVWLVRGAPAADLLALVDDRLTKEGKWSRLGAEQSGANRGRWRMTDTAGESWEGQASVENGDEAGSLRLRLQVRRAARAQR